MRRQQLAGAVVVVPVLVLVLVVLLLPLLPLLPLLNEARIKRAAARLNSYTSGEFAYSSMSIQRAAAIS